MTEWLWIGAVAFAVGLSGALSPGPLTVLAIRVGARRGWRAGPFATAGHAVAEAVAIILLALGLSAYVRPGSAALTVISLVGGAVLVWLGWRTARSIPGASLTSRLHEAVAREDGGDGARTGQGGAVAGVSSFGAFRAVAVLGIAVSVANPYWLVWWATVGTKLTVDSLRIGWPGPAAVFVGHIFSDLLWLSFVATLVSSGSRWLGDRAYRGLLGLCAVFLVALGAAFFVSGVRAVIPG